MVAFLKANEVLLSNIDSTGQHSFQVHYVPTNYSILNSTLAIQNAVVQHNAVGVVGDWLSIHTIPQALASASTYTWMCSGSATSGQLSDKTSFPYFFRTVAQDPAQGPAFMGLMKHFGWSTVSIVAASDPYAQSIYNAILASAPVNGVTITAHRVIQPGQTDFSAVLDMVFESGSQIVFLSALAQDVVVLMRQARARKMIGPDWVWIGPDAFNYYSDLPVTQEDIENMNGFMHFASLERSNTAKFNDSIARFNNMYPGESIPGFSFLFLDCLLAMGRGILNIVNVSSAADVLARNYHPNLQRFFLEDPFEGVTGQVLFDKDGNRRSPFQVYNWWKGVATPVYDVLPDSSVVPRAPVRFYSGTSTVPRDRPEQLALVPTFDRATGIALLIANSIVAAAICVVWGYLVYYRHDPTVLALSFPFLNLISLGCVLVVASNIAGLGVPTALTCQLSSWLFAFGFELVVASSAAKAFRLWRIYHNRFLKIGRFDTKKLFMGVLVVLAGQSFILIVWSAIGPQTPVLMSSRTFYYFKCSSQSPAAQTAFAAISTVYNGILLVALIFLAYKTRAIQTNYRESSWMLYVSQNTLLSGIIIMTFQLFQFGEATLAAFVVKQSTIMYAVSFAFAALVGRIAIVAHHTHTKGQHAGASVARALMSGSVAGGPAASPAKGVGGKKHGAESLAIKTMEVRSLPFTSPTSDGTQVTGSAAISEACPTSSCDVVCRGVYPVKRLGSLFATWHLHQICIFSKDGYLTLIQDQPAVGGPVFGTTLLLQQIRYDPAPSGFDNCLEVACGNLAWLIQFSTERERDTWVSLLAVTATSKVSQQNSKSSSRPSTREVSRSRRVGSPPSKQEKTSSSDDRIG